MRGEGSVADEGRVFGVPNFHSWGKCTMPLMNINSDWMSNASSGLYTINLYYTGPLTCILGCIFIHCCLSLVASPPRQYRATLSSL